MARQATFTPKRDLGRNTSPWWISIPPKLSDDGKRQKRFFQTKELADGEIQRLKVRKENHGTAAKLLSPADEQQSAAAFKLLRDKGITKQLSEIIGEYIKREDARKASKTLSFTWAAYIKQLKEDGASEAHQKNHKRTLKRFSSLHETLLADLTEKDIEDVISGSSKSYYNVQLRELSSVLNFGIVKEWLKASPVKKGSFKKRKLGEVEIYTPQEIKALMEVTMGLYSELVPGMALMAFGGIRPDYQDGEITKVEWQHLLMATRDKNIELPASITKTGKRRTIKIRPALASWLQWHKDSGGTTTGLVCAEKGEPLRKKLREIFRSTKVNGIQVERIQDGLRHSFGSYLSKNVSLDVAEQELGHAGGRELLNRHYRQDIKAATASSFWALRAPKVLKVKAKGQKDGLSKILQFKAKAA